MGDDYLWDRSGPPDPEVERLERRLASFRTSLPEPVWPAESAGSTPRRHRLLLPLAAAAVLILAVAVWMGVPRGADSPWAITHVEGELLQGPPAGTQSGRLVAGEWIETGSGSRLLLAAKDVGQITVAPGSRLRVVAGSAQEHRLQLARGTLQAVIWAPPGRLVVDTPSSTLVDLGCAYTLHVDAAGVGRVEVTAGWVGFAYDGRESFIPAGAIALTRPELGPGTPYYMDASPAFRYALAMFDVAVGAREQQAHAVVVVIEQARRRDALTLWHLLSRVDASERGRLYDRLATFAPPPGGVTRAGILRGDRAMLDLWWNALGHGELDWWRIWQQQWRDVAR